VSPGIYCLPASAKNPRIRPLRESSRWRSLHPHGAALLGIRKKMTVHELPRHWIPMILVGKATTKAGEIENVV
jgi:hypothetical protein